jgi:hypothetical protein
MGTLAETANVDYRLSLTDQEKQMFSVSVFHTYIYIRKTELYKGWGDQSWTKMVVSGLHVLLKLTVALKSTG